jgi:ABC-type nitrate/sulfonate/bicarbonate transport system ATPase subunit
MLGRLHRLPASVARSRGDELLERIGLADVADHLVRTYSGGMRRRLDLAATLVARPQVLFLDEPTTGLDPQSRNDLWDLLRELVRDGTTIVLTTQYLEEATAWPMRWSCSTTARWRRPAPRRTEEPHRRDRIAVSVATAGARTGGAGTRPVLDGRRRSSSTRSTS